MADPKLIDAVNSVQSVARTFRAVIALADAVDDVTKLDQLSTEAQQRLEAKKAEEATLTASLGDLVGRIDEAQLAVAQQKDLARKVKDDAEATAREAKRAAASEAAEIVRLATVQADTLRGGLDAEAQTLREQIRTLAEEKVAADNAVAEAKGTLAALEAQIAEARATIAKLLGV